MSMLEEIFGDRVKKPAGPPPSQPRTKRPPPPKVRARDLVSEARNVGSFELAGGLRAIIEESAADAFRALAANLTAQAQAQGLRSVVLSSCYRGEGRTTTAIGLGLSMAQSPGTSVLLLEGDLRHPKMKEYLSLPVRAGLDDVLAGKADVAEAMVFCEDDNLAVLPVRYARSKAANILDSPAMKELAPLLLASFDHVICDSTPALSTRDPSVLGKQMGGVALVVQAAATRRESAGRAMSVFKQAGVPLLGLILNHTRFYVPRCFRSAENSANDDSRKPQQA